MHAYTLPNFWHDQIQDACHDNIKELLHSKSTPWCHGKRDCSLNIIVGWILRACAEPFCCCLFVEGGLNVEEAEACACLAWACVSGGSAANVGGTNLILGRLGSAAGGLGKPDRAGGKRLRKA